MQHKQTEENKSLNISVAIFEPLVMKADNRYIGFEIDLWEQIAKELKLDYTYSEYKLIAGNDCSLDIRMLTFFGCARLKAYP